MTDSMWTRIAAFLSGGAAALWASLPDGMHALLLFMAADVVTGIACGLRGHRFASSAMGRGFNRKIAELAVAFIAMVLHAKLGLHADVVAFVTWGLVAKEIASILENAKALGLDTAALRPLFDRFLTERIPKGSPLDRPTITPPITPPDDAEG